MDPGVTLFDNDLKLASHNDRFMALFELPTTLISGSVELMDILAYLAGQGSSVTKTRTQASKSFLPCFRAMHPLPMIIIAPMVW